MRYHISVTNRFKKDIKKCQKRHLPMEKLKEVVRILEENGKLPHIYKPHKLSGNGSSDKLGGLSVYLC